MMELSFFEELRKKLIQNLITPSAMNSNPTEWLTNFLMNNPGLIPLLQVCKFSLFVLSLFVAITNRS